MAGTRLVCLAWDSVHAYLAHERESLDIISARWMDGHDNLARKDDLRSGHCHLDFRNLESEIVVHEGVHSQQQADPGS